MNEIFNVMYFDEISGNFFENNIDYWLRVFGCNSWYSCSESNGSAVTTFGNPLDPLNIRGTNFLLHQLQSEEQNFDSLPELIDRQLSLLQ